MENVRLVTVSIRTKIITLLLMPVDGMGLGVFRIAFGFILFWQATKYLDRGWVQRHIHEAQFHFTYWPFDWVAPLPDEGMFVILAFMALFSLFVTIGFCYRLSAAALFLITSYVFLIERALYLNHFYLSLIHI